MSEESRPSDPDDVRRLLQILEEVRTDLHVSVNQADIQGFQQKLAKVPEQFHAPLVHSSLHWVLGAPETPPTTVFNGQLTIGQAKRVTKPEALAAYEENLAAMVPVLVAAGADPWAYDHDKRIPGQVAFTNSGAMLDHRAPAALAIVKETLRSDPNWMPNLQRVFKELHVQPGEEGAAEYRQDVADHINKVGTAVVQWLHSDDPSAVAVRLRQDNPVSKLFWKKEDWDIRTTNMPWMSAEARIQLDAEAADFDKKMAVFFGSKPEVAAGEMAGAAIARIRGNRRGAGPAGMG
jgi:hypothetical protein